LKEYNDTDQQAPGLNVMAVLLEKADSQGFLTTDDVLEALPDADEAMDQL